MANFDKLKQEVDNFGGKHFIYINITSGTKPRLQDSNPFNLKPQNVKLSPTENAITSQLTSLLNKYFFSSTTSTTPRPRLTPLVEDIDFANVVKGNT